jgi:peptidoglycan hydrolase-like protein with peptidoglycan-binding domain
MAILTGSVGKNGKNNGSDVKAVQDLLNASSAVAKITADGRYGPSTFKAILQYQMSVFPTENSWDGLIGAGGKTLRYLNDPKSRPLKRVGPAEVDMRARKLGGHGPSNASPSPTPAIATAPLRIVTSSYRGFSGRRWCDEFPTSTNINDLASPFRENFGRFYAALRNAGLTAQQLHVAATFRPAERAWLMHWAFKIAHGHDPRTVPARAGININWVHVDARGNYNAQASKNAAIEMNAKYGTRYQPSLTSAHIIGNAIDISFQWGQAISIVNGQNKTVSIPAGNSASSMPLRAVGASYMVHKLPDDPPHWSSTGR